MTEFSSAVLFGVLGEHLAALIAPINGEAAVGALCCLLYTSDAADE